MLKVIIIYNESEMSMQKLISKLIFAQDFWRGKGRKNLTLQTKICLI